MDQVLNRDTIIAALKDVKYPGYSRDIVSFGFVQEVTIHDGQVQLKLSLPTRNESIRNQLLEQIKKTVLSLEGIRSVDVVLEQPSQAIQSGDPWERRRPVPGIGKVIAVASGKGGVGKSTVAVNLAAALARIGVETGLLDCDIYGPTVPILLGLQGKSVEVKGDRLLPIQAFELKVMSIGLLIDPDQPVIWRGPMLGKAIEQFLFGVEWGHLDILVVDLPPGTGDAALSLCQLVPVDGGIIVTTPQEVALGVVRKGIAMFDRVRVPLIGLVENMSYFQSPDGSRIAIFGSGGGRAEAERLGIRFLGEIPIYVELRESGDRGVPILQYMPDSPAAHCFLRLAESVRTVLSDLEAS